MDCKYKVIICTAILIAVIIAITVSVVIFTQRNLSMDLQHKAFDDQYKGCEEEMMKKAEEFLDEEKKADYKFKELWDAAEKRWESLTRHHKEKHIQKPFEIAVIAYTNKTKFPRKFNDNVRTCCNSIEDYKKNFKYKAFHFYLTQAIQNLRLNKCISVVRGMSGKYNSVSREMRFGQFASSSTNINMAKDFAKGSGTLHYIYTCLGASIQHLSCNKSQEEVLIPPYEVFSVSNFESVSNGLDRVNLESTTTCSNFNCAFQGGKKENNCPSNSAPGNILAWPEHLTHRLLFGLLILFFQG